MYREEWRVGYLTLKSNPMNLQGKGEQLRTDIPQMIVMDKDLDSFDAKYGKEVREVIMNNFIIPLIIDKEKWRSSMGSKLDLFCAAFI